MDIANQYSTRFAVGGLPRRTLAPECQRIELAVFTVNSLMTRAAAAGIQESGHQMECEEPAFLHRRPERGVVLAIGNFTTPPEYPKNNNGSVVFEVFKFRMASFVKSRHFSAATASCIRAGVRVGILIHYVESESRRAPRRTLAIRS